MHPSTPSGCRQLFAHDLPLMLCQLLGDPNFRRDAADCLLLLVERRGNKEDRAPLLRLLGALPLLTQAGPSPLARACAGPPGAHHRPHVQCPH